MTDYLTDFVQESEERITELNNALLTLERDPDDEEAMENIFRIAHTLKGNCGAMGLDSASDLAHAIEDLLDDVRRGDIEVTPELMDVVFDAVDELETMIDEVAATGEIETDPSATIDALRTHLEHAEDEAATGLAAPTAAEIDDVCARFDPPADDGHDVYLARLEIAERAGVNNGKLVVDALIDAFDLIGTDPPRETIEAAEYGDGFDAVFGTAVGEAAISSGLEPVEEVADFRIVDVSDRFETDDDSPAAGESAAADPGDGISSEEAADLEVDDLLDEFTEFDDLDEMVEDVDDDELEAFENMGEAGSFDDLLEAEDIDLEAEPGEPPADSLDEDAAAEPETAPADAAETETDDASTVDADSASDADDEVDDASAVFNELKDEVEMVGFDELQDELAELEFDEFDEEEEVDMDELLGDDIDDDSFLDDEEPSESAVDDMLVGAESDDDELESVADPAEEAIADETATVETDEENAAEDVPVADDLEAAAGDDHADESEPIDSDAGASDDRAVSEDDALDGDETVDDERAADDVTVAEPASDDGAADGTVDDDEVDDEEVDDPGSGETEGVDDGEPDDDVAVVDTGDAEPTDADDEPATADEATDTADVDEATDTATVDDITETAETADASLETEDTDVEAADEFAVTDSVDSDEDDAAADDSFDATVEDEFEPAAAFGDDVETSADDSDPFDDAGAAAFDDGTTGDTMSEPADFEADDVENEFDDGAFDDDPFDETDSFDIDEAEFDAPAAESETDADSITPSTESFGDDAGDSDADADDVVRIVDEPALEIPDIDVPETSDRPDADAEADEIQSVRVDVEQIDSLLTLVEGLVTSRVRLRHAAEADDANDALETELDALSDLTTDLQETVMDIRLVPLQTVANRLPRVVRDIAREQDKEVAFEMTGEEVELDRSILDRIGDPLIHLVRNAVDHGVEPPAEREAADKPREGTVEVHADRSRDRVSITVEDDGAGLDPDRLRTEAIEAGVVDEDEAAAMPDEEIYDLIFHPGLSTADEVTDVSGRGVGMDVVKRTVEDLDGTVSIDSAAGEGTTVTMRLPVTVAIDEILFVESGGEEFGVPTKAVQDIESAASIQTADEESVLPGDDGDYPVVSLADVLETPMPGANGDGMVVRIRDEVREVALHCDHVRGQQEVVVKPFEGFMSGVPGISGATVRGRGEVVNILDVTTL